MVGSRAVLEAAFPDGMPMPDAIEGELPALRRRFWIATSLHTDPNDYVYYGTRSGQFFGVKRLSASEAEVRLKTVPAQQRRISRFAGIDGEERLMSEETRLYEPRERPWYKAGQSADAHTWTSVYIDFRTNELVSTRARKVLSLQGQVQGVVATDVSLRALNDFVSALSISAHGFAFIVEPGGDLIAASAGANVARSADGAMMRLQASASTQPLVRAGFAEMQRALAAAPEAKLPQTRSFIDADGQPVYIAYDRLKDEAGLDWLVVVGVPERDFTAGIADNMMRTVWLSLLALLIAVIGGTLFYAWVARDLRALTDAARRIGEGDLDVPVGVTRRDEIGDLARGFESMQSRLRTDALTGLANPRSGDAALEHLDPRPPRRRHPARDRRALHRPRRFQARQRRTRPPGRQRGAGRCGSAPERLRARRRPGGPLRRRRVRHRAARSARPHHRRPGARQGGDVAQRRFGRQPGQEFSSLHRLGRSGGVSRRRC